MNASVKIKGYLGFRFQFVICTLMLMFSSIVSAVIIDEEVKYKSGDTVMNGYLAYDDSISGKRPGILVVHEWWGHNEYARKRARMLASLGYTALAVDMYGNGKQASHPQDAGKFAGEVRKNMPVARSRFEAAIELLRKHKTTNNKIAAIGYCFGGGLLLELARMGIELDGIVSFHGSLATQSPAKPGNVKAKILVCHGTDDPFVKKEHIAALKKEMNNAKVDFTFKEYSGAKHAFTNPEADGFGKKFNLPLQYNKQADEQSWEEMKSFLQTVFQ